MPNLDIGNCLPTKRWSCAVDMLLATRGSSSSRRTSNNRGNHRTSTFVDFGRPSDDLSAAESGRSLFDPNDPQYRCCCGQGHSTTGVRVIAGMLCVTVLFELWQLSWHWATSPSPTSTLPSSLTQLGFGLLLAATVSAALWRECSALLLPYLLLQAVGLGAVFIIFLALLYVVLDQDLDTVRSLVENYGPMKGMDEESSDNYAVYMGWTLCASCLGLLALQLWLISIVFACWRYFRDKHSHFGRNSSAHATSALVVLRSLNGAETETVADLNAPRNTLKGRKKGVISAEPISMGEYMLPQAHRNCRTMSANY